MKAIFLRLDDYFEIPEHLTEHTFVLTIFTWSETYPSHLIDSHLQCLIKGGFEGPLKVARIASMVQMVEYYTGEPNFLVLRDMPIYLGALGLIIGRQSPEPLPAQITF